MPNLIRIYYPSIYSHLHIDQTTNQEIQGNELADQAAKGATLSKGIINPTITYCEAKKLIHHVVIDTGTKNGQNRHLLSSMEYAILFSTNYQPIIYMNIVLSLLQISHTNISHIHQITKTNPNRCPHAIYVLSQCQEYQHQRNKNNYSWKSNISSIIPYTSRACSGKLRPLA